MSILVVILVAIAIVISFVIGMLVGRQNISMVDKGKHLSREALEKLKEKSDEIRKIREGK